MSLIDTLERKNIYILFLEYQYQVDIDIRINEKQEHPIKYNFTSCTVD